MKMALPPVSPSYKKIMGIHRFVNHVRSYEIIDRYPALPDVLDPQVNQHIRIKFLQGEIDRDKFKWILQKREKSREYKHRIHDVMETFVHVSTDILNKFIADETRLLDKIDRVKKEFEAIREYTNKVLKDLSEKAGITIPFFDEELHTPLRTMRYK